VVGTGRHTVTITSVPPWADPLSVAGRAAEPIVDLWEHLIEASTVPLTGSNVPATAPETAQRRFRQLRQEPDREVPTLAWQLCKAPKRP